MAISQNTTGYCLLEDVQALTGKSYTSATRPTSASVESMIMYRADIINGTLSALGYAVPIGTTATRSCRILIDLNAKGAAADADNAVPGLQEENPRSRAWKDDFDRSLKALRDRTLDLPDASTTNDTPVTLDNRSPAGTFNLDSDSVERDPVFDRDTDL
jgi:hypothetical protein